MGCEIVSQQSEEARLIRRRLYEMKNGIVADALRAGGCPYRMIWGLNLPQINDIAASFEQSRELALELWNDTSLREARLVGVMLFPVGELDIATAQKMLANIKWTEDADILCFKLLKRAPFAIDLARSLSESREPLQRYAALRLFFNLVSQYPNEALEAAKSEMTKDNPLTALASMLAEEAGFVLGME